MTETSPPPLHKEIHRILSSLLCLLSSLLWGTPQPESFIFRCFHPRICLVQTHGRRDCSLVWVAATEKDFRLFPYLYLLAIIYMPRSIPLPFQSPLPLNILYKHASITSFEIISQFYSSSSVFLSSSSFSLYTPHALQSLLT